MTAVNRLYEGRAWIELDGSALRQNLSFFTERAHGKKVIPVLKANAYGYGETEIMSLLQDTETEMIACACIEEAVSLRENGWNRDILILGYTCPQDFDLLEQYDVTQTLPDHAYACRLNESGCECKVHIAVDTGMHRIGFSWEDPERILDVFAFEHLKVTGMFTHLCTSDKTENSDFTDMQIRRMEEAAAYIRKQGYDPGIIHISATYGILNYPRIKEDAVRLGIGMFGVLNDENDSREYGAVLKPVLSLHARVISVRNLKQGEYAGYGKAYQAEKDMQIAAISIGYGDGLPRDLSMRGGYVLIHGQKAKLIGRICTDQALADVTGIATEEGDTVTLIGRDGNEEITVGMWAEWEDTITIDVLTRLSARPARIIKNYS